MAADTRPWQPGAALKVLQQRARMLQQLRAFFAQRQVLEVETPVLGSSAVTDPHIESIPVQVNRRDGYLQTSPEFFMKRLLAAYPVAMYQVSKVFRDGEAGRRHNPEFTLLEWYRPGLDHHALMDEVDALVRELLALSTNLGDTIKSTYQDVFSHYAGLDPFSASREQLQQCVQQAGIEVVGMDSASRDDWLDLIMSHVVEPRLPVNCPVFIHDFPASQAALARCREDNGLTVAERFELYINGMELANGFQELTEAREQRQRFERDIKIRSEQQQAAPQPDQNLLQALEAGLPECAGVALGLDRVLMLIAGTNDIRDVLSFDFERL